MQEPQDLDGSPRHKAEPGLTRSHVCQSQIRHQVKKGAPLVDMIFSSTRTWHKAGILEQSLPYLQNGPIQDYGWSVGLHQLSALEHIRHNVLGPAMLARGNHCIKCNKKKITPLWPVWYFSATSPFLVEIKQQQFQNSLLKTYFPSQDRFLFKILRFTSSHV